MDLFTLETMGLARSFEQLSAGFRWQVPPASTSPGIAGTATP
jgi:hypothetical protein